MRITPIKAYKFRQILVVTIIWIILGLIIETILSITYDPFLDTYYFYSPLGRNLITHLLVYSVGPLLAGLAGGSIIILYLRSALRKYSYGVAQLILTSYYLVVTSFTVVIVAMVASSFATGGQTWWERFTALILDVRVLQIMIIWYLIVMATLFMLDVNDKYGPGVLRNLYKGKYHRPRKERRIFMFLDLKGSTSIAEMIGDEKYFRLLQKFFSIITIPIINHYGEIYQYVGDEVTVSWKPKQGLRKSHCLRCFFDIREVMNKYEPEFISEFGVMPDFKAGMHMGEVTTGEIGLVKRDIIYSGDILNTTSRIMGLCNRFKQELIISKRLREQLHDDQKFYFEVLRTLQLRGKQEQITLIGVHLAEKLISSTETDNLREKVET